MSYFLTTQRRGFSLWEDADLPLACSLWGDEAVARFICAAGHFSGEEIAQRLALERENYRHFHIQYFPLRLLEDGCFVGCCGLRPWQGHSDILELGIHLKSPFWHRGLAQEGACAMMNYAFQTLGTKELRAGHHPDNAASRSLLARLGFQYIGDEFYPPTGRMHPSYQFIAPDQEDT